MKYVNTFESFDRLRIHSDTKIYPVGFSAGAWSQLLAEALQELSF